MQFDLMELKAQRVRKGRTQKEVADVLNIKPNTYTRKEAGEIKITVEEFQKICNFLEVTDYNIFFTQSADEK